MARAQGNLRGGLVLGLEDTASRMNRLGRSEIDHGRQRTIAESLDRIAAVTAEQVRELARELLSGPLVGGRGRALRRASSELPSALRRSPADRSDRPLAQSVHRGADADAAV